MPGCDCGYLLKKHWQTLASRRKFSRLKAGNVKEREINVFVINWASGECKLSLKGKVSYPKESNNPLK